MALNLVCIFMPSSSVTPTPGIDIEILNEAPGSQSTSVSEDVGSVVFQITALEDASVRVYSLDSGISATRKLVS